MTETYEGSDALRVIADAVDSNKRPQDYQHLNTFGWLTPHNWQDLLTKIGEGDQIREVPRIKHLITDEGDTYKFPEPIKTRPIQGDSIFIFI